MVVEHLFSEGADEGLPPERTMVAFFGALEDIGDMEGAFGGHEYVMYDIHIRLTFCAERGRGALFGSSEGAQGAKLSQGACFKNFNEVIFG